MPTLIDATVIVMISRGILRTPRRPRTLEATNILGNTPINIILNDLNKTSNIKAITANTMARELV